MNPEIIERLESAGIAPTPVRVLVYKALLDSINPLSLSDIENILITVDKSTVSRTLSTFKARNILHSFTDGSGSLKYELCHDLHNDGHSHEDLHVHFRCTKCGKTICLPSVKVPQVEIPEGFIVNEVNYILSGLCSKCSTD